MLTVIIRHGTVMLLLLEVEINPTSQPVVGHDQLRAIAAAAVENLP